MTADEALLALQQREPIFHRPELGTDFASMVTDDFWEIGASGKIYTREFVLSVLSERQHQKTADIWQTSDFACRKLSDEYFLLTYNLTQDHTRQTRRTTLWFWTSEDWKIAFHQGTLVQS